MARKKALPANDFAKKQLEEIRKINDDIRKKTRKTILIAFVANLLLVVFMILSIWYFAR